ncbi:Neurocan core protein [Portunus trituberculatus]|uniref:Neurocan core protein n=2 Tax=Portunus trituberculatus TaxID=210409 RepID=A0A5B7JMT6_PORTR|nr:Neurocan core protein [Portunus trituberculatus]
MLQQSTWIGLNDLEDPGNYTWDDCTEFIYSNWGENEPNNFYSIGGFLTASEDCVEMREQFGYQWNDKRCSTKNA